MNTQEKDAVLAALKPGDKVIIGAHGANEAVAVVAKMTATQIVTMHTNGVGNSYTRRWKRDGGREIGGGSSWRTCYLNPATPELVRAIEAKAQRAADLAFIRNADLSKVAGIELSYVVAYLVKAGAVDKGGR